MKRREKDGETKGQRDRDREGQWDRYGVEGGKSWRDVVERRTKER
jgi:hypothetical protein